MELEGRCAPRFAKVKGAFAKNFAGKRARRLVADCDARVSLAYVMNRMSPGTTGDKRLGRLLRAFYGGLA